LPAVAFFASGTVRTANHPQTTQENTVMTYTFEHIQTELEELSAECAALTARWKEELFDGERLALRQRASRYHLRLSEAIQKQFVCAQELGSLDLMRRYTKQHGELEQRELSGLMPGLFSTPDELAEHAAKFAVVTAEMQRRAGMLQPPQKGGEMVH
jgi:hypothetical protein